MFSGICGLGAILGHYLGQAKDIGSYFTHRLVKGVWGKDQQGCEEHTLTSVSTDVEAHHQAWELQNNQHTATQHTLPQTLDQFTIESELFSTNCTHHHAEDKTEAGKLGKEDAQHLQTLGHFPTGEHLLRAPEPQPEASNKPTFPQETNPLACLEPPQWLLQENQNLKTSLATKDETIRLLWESIHILCQVIKEATHMDTQHQQVELENNRLQMKQQLLHKIEKGQELFLTAKKNEVHALQNQLAEIQQVNETLEQSMANLAQFRRLLDTTHHVSQDTPTHTHLAHNLHDNNIRATVIEDESGQVLQTLDNFSPTKEDIQASLHVSHRTPFMQESPELTQPGTSSQSSQLQGTSHNLEASLAPTQATTTLLLEQTHTMPSSKNTTTTLETQHHQMSLQIKQLEGKQLFLQKLLKAKGIFMKAKNKQLRSLRKSLEDKEKENDTLRQTLSTLSRSTTDTMSLETQHDPESSALEEMRKKQQTLEKLMRGKGLVIRHKTQQLHTLQDTLVQKEEENRILKQSVTQLEEAVSTLQMEIQQRTQEHETSPDTVRETKEAYVNTERPMSIQEDPLAACALREELHTRERLLREKEDRCQQLFSATEAILKQILLLQQEKDTTLLGLHQKHLKEQALQRALESLQDMFSHQHQEEPEEQESEQELGEEELEPEELEQQQEPEKEEQEEPQLKQQQEEEEPEQEEEEEKPDLEMEEQEPHQELKQEPELEEPEKQEAPKKQEEPEETEEQEEEQEQESEP
ncbi:thyroid receptor-interacting protein 11-like [Ochotona curzoniae]|uniref:thyroid receptor-interacting protein 11-like n=1 Tax=Ochotona curzoniae TaxID=130825 RepID=UPI001B34D343|nr:thyroid receptor-interacting protein 11-like [Ochotona curzoniae]